MAVTGGLLWLWLWVWVWVLLVTMDVDVDGDYGCVQFVCYVWQGMHASRRDRLMWQLQIGPTMKEDWERLIGDAPAEVKGEG